MNFLYWGGKTFYYSLVDKQGAKHEVDPGKTIEVATAVELYDESDCESCKL